MTEIAKPQTTRATDNVVVTDISMPFGSMVVFMVKWAIAAIPAVLILAVIATLTIATVRGVFLSAPDSRLTPSSNELEMDAFLDSLRRAAEFPP
jgi:CHASE2 domain-containing sensor protein